MQIPKIEVRENGEIWVCIGYNDSNESLGVVKHSELVERDLGVAANERKRMAFVLDHIEEFAAWIQWRGNKPTEALPMLEVNFPWAFEAKLKPERG